MILLAVLTGIALILGVVILAIGLSGRTQSKINPFRCHQTKSSNGSVKDCIIEGFFK